jgi:4-amino-4-deoxy-L-arabinose transferase-like glycosyltransferase
LLPRKFPGAALAILCGVAVWFLYFFGLTRVGVLGPDEPRYTAIGRAMADSGDWITPRLWTQPWFEKPPVIYWLTATGFNFGLGPEAAPRIPVAITSVAFLVSFFLALRPQFGQRAAMLSATILATCPGWLAYSHLGLPDLPMSAAFAMAMLTVASGWLTPARVITAGVLLGVAILAKGLVPLVLFLPAFWFLRKEPLKAAGVVGVALAVAAPWYLLVFSRNGSRFIDVFFVQQQFSRFLSGKFLHEQPFWFYIPVLAGGIFPWTPLAPLLFSKRLYEDRRVRFLLAWAAFGFLFFSASRGKLPGYLLPVLPPIAGLLGISIDRVPRRSATLLAGLAAAAVLLVLVPTVQEALPQALTSGIGHAPIHFFAAWLTPVALVAGLCLFFELRDRRLAAVMTVAAFTTILIANFVRQGFPILDRTVSARRTWSNTIQPITCIPHDRQYLRYGLDYYVGRELPDCK